MPTPQTRIIYLQRSAPAKPPLGQACNGCGVCCAAETCPVARVFLLQWTGPCPALAWQGAEQRYACGMLVRPASYLAWLPNWLAPWFARRVRRWIAAGIGCDSAAEPSHFP